jgi:RNA polymerase sigma factor (sigma-70 family)
VEWQEIYSRLRRDREDGQAWGALDQRVRTWARPELWGRGWHVVDDVVADTCSAVVVGLEGAHGGDTFAGFVRGHYLNARRRALREGHRPEVSLAPGLDVPAPAPETWPDEDELGALRRCLAVLPPRERDAVRLRHFEGRSSAEMGSELGVTEGNARRILCLGMARLRRCLAGLLPASSGSRGAPARPQPAVATTGSTELPGRAGPEGQPDPGRPGQPDEPDGR